MKDNEYPHPNPENPRGLKLPSTNDKHHLRAIRVARGFSLDQLADRSGYSDISISNWENDKFSPFQKIIDLAQALGVSPKDFFKD
jgi:lambda repressor-like predicted transcriptional regulator